MRVHSIGRVLVSINLWPRRLSIPLFLLIIPMRWKCVLLYLLDAALGKTIYNSRGRDGIFEPIKAMRFRVVMFSERSVLFTRHKTGNDLHLNAIKLSQNVWCIN